MRLSNEESLGWLKGERFFCCSDGKLSLSLAFSPSDFGLFSFYGYDRGLLLGLLSVEWKGLCFLFGKKNTFSGHQKSKIVISPTDLCVIRHILTRARRLTLTNFRIGFHFEPRGELPSRLCKSRWSENELLTSCSLTSTQHSSRDLQRAFSPFSQDCFLFPLVFSLFSSSTSLLLETCLCVAVVELAAHMFSARNLNLMSCSPVSIGMTQVLGRGCPAFHFPLMGTSVSIDNERPVSVDEIGLRSS